jgi:hypothetical protein
VSEATDLRKGTTLRLCDYHHPTRVRASFTVCILPEASSHEWKEKDACGTHVGRALNEVFALGKGKYKTVEVREVE